MDEVNYNFKAWKDELIKYLNLDSVKPKIGYQINEEILERAYQIVINYLKKKTNFINFVVFRLLDTQFM